MPIAAVQNDTQLAVWHQDESATLIDIEFMVKKEVPVAVMKVYKMLFRQVEAIFERVRRHDLASVLSGVRALSGRQ